MDLFSDPILVACATAAHEINKVYCIALGDTSQVHWNAAPYWQRESCLKGAKLVIDKHKKGEAQSMSASHESWLEEKKRTGWTYGPVKDATAKKHPCMVSYEELSPEQRNKDALFLSSVVAMYKALTEK